MRYIFLAFPLLLAACSTPATGSADEPSGEPAAATARPGSDANHGGPATVAPGAALIFTVQEGWTAEAPASSMRVAQYRVPGDSGSADASLVVYHFAKSGGSLDANIQRWASQFEQPDGRDSMDLLERAERTVAGMRAHEAYLSGTYVAETRPGSGERVNHPGWRLMAAIIESDHGPYYVKLVGPEATVRASDGAFRRFLGAIRIGS